MTTFAELLKAKRPWWAWLADRRLVGLDATDVSAALKAYLAKIAGLSEIDLDQAIAQAAELTGVKPETIRRQLKKGDKVDGRAKTSAENGAKGGRKRIVYAELADEFAGLNMKDGLFRYRRWRDRWWRYDAPLWTEISAADMKSLVTTFTGRRYPEYSETRAVSNILLNLERLDRGKIPDVLDAPMWLPDSGGTRHTPAGHWLTMKNGLLNIDEAVKCFDGGEWLGGDDVFQKTTPQLFNVHCMDYPFDPASACPLWHEFLKVVQPNVDDRHLLQMLAGLLLVPEVRFNVFFLLTGPSGCGKSVFLYVIEQLLGSHNTCCVPLSEFDNEHYRFLLTEKLLNSIDDMPATGQMRDVEGHIKIATDGRPMAVRRLYENGANAPVIARTVAACNTLPRFYEKSDAIFDRLRIVPFMVKVRGTGRQDSRLRFKIAENELPGVFLWALQGLAALQDLQLFPEHSAGAGAKEKHQAACDPIGTYLKENYHMPPGAPGVESKYIYEHYRKWAEASGHKPASIGTVNEAVERQFEVEKQRFRLIPGEPPAMAFRGLQRRPEIESIDDIPI